MISLFGHSVRSELVLLYVIEALAFFGATYVFLSLGRPAGPAANPGANAAFAGALAVCFGPISGAGGLYRPDTWSRLSGLLAGALLVGLLLPPLVLVLNHVLGSVGPDERIHRALPAILAVGVGSVVLVRVGFAIADRLGFFTRRVVVVGPPGDDRTISRRHGRGLSLRHVGLERLGSGELDPVRLRGEGVWAVVVPHGGAVADDQVRTWMQAGLRVFDDVEFAEHQSGQVRLEALPQGWIARSHVARESRLEQAIRRSIDISLALGLLLLALPVLLITILAIKLDSPGPIFYRQMRVGRHGSVFTLFKFRSMTENAEAGGKAQWAVQHDPRVTRVGRFIRATRIDEIPQVLNVLLGHMAFVGPRPERPEFVDELSQVIPHYDERAYVKPGITGWAQVNFPYGASVEDARQKLAFDLYYVRRRSLFLDLLILVATVHVVLFREGSR